MGSEYGARCRKCGKKFRVQDGGGFTFFQVRCDQCGHGRFIDFKDLGELHCRYIKGLGGPYSIATAEHDKRVQEDHAGEPLTEDEYHKLIEGLAGRHRCGGHFRFDAPVRCIRCGSTEIEEDEESRYTCCYD